MRVLLITPSFFGYEQTIAQEFRTQGHSIEVLDERPSNGPLRRGLVRVAPAFLARQIRKHYETLVSRLTPDQYDALIVIKGEVLPPQFLDVFVELNPKARRAFYTFDSLTNSPQAKRILEFFPDRFTFDREDARSHAGFKYKPLFYAPEYAASDQTRDLLVSFVGTLHGERYAFARAATKYLPQKEQRLFFYVPAIWYFWIRKVISRQVRPVRRAEVSATPMTRQEIVAVTQRSRAVLDLQRAGQSGLTMRTFETLATGTALITANEAIRDEPFYDPKRILVVSRDPGSIDGAQVAEFVKNLAGAHVPEGFEAYALKNWVAHLVKELS